jgi:N-acetylglucosaminyldiphosphoundecaprenol N-acetyl-beta-D-mannosaminyltransferase
MLNFKELLGYRFVNNTMDELVEEVQERITSSQKTFIVTANPEIVTYAHSDIEYGSVLKGADFIIPDGVGIIFASKILDNPIQERLTGFDLMEQLLKVSNTNKFKIYLLGTMPNVIDLTAANINKKYPYIQVVGFHHGFFEDDEFIIEEIRLKKPDIIFVGTGFPKQEKWISNNLHHFTKGVFMGVGGCLNVWAGVDKRAPKVWRDLNLEWIYRLIKQPTRFKRMLAIPVFIKKVLNKEF